VGTAAVVTSRVDMALSLSQECDRPRLVADRLQVRRVVTAMSGFVTAVKSTKAGASSQAHEIKPGDYFSSPPSVADGTLAGRSCVTHEGVSLQTRLLAVLSSVEEGAWRWPLRLAPGGIAGVLLRDGRYWRRTPGASHPPWHPLGPPSEPPAMLDACADTIVAVLRLTGTLI